MIDELNGDFLQWLRGFYYVAKSGSVRKAAELMRRNPSTISYQLHSLEMELGVLLFDRYKKTLKITEEGKKLLQWTISAFETLQGMRSAVGNVKGSLKGKIRIAATLPIASTSVAPICAFLQENPEVELELERCLAIDVRKAVEESTVDFGLLPVIIKPQDGVLDVVAKSRPMLVLHKDNPWKIPAIPDWQDLSKLPYVAFIDGNAPDDLRQYILSKGLPDFIFENAAVKLNNFHLIMRFVWQKLGVAIMDEMCLEATLFGADWTDLKKLPLDHLLPNRLYGLLTRKKKYISPQASACMKHLKKYFLEDCAQDQARLWSVARQEKKGTANMGKPRGKTTIKS